MKYITAAQNVKVSPESAAAMILCDHELAKLSKQEDLTTMCIDFDDTTSDRLKQISEGLHISIDAVVMKLLLDVLDDEKLQRIIEAKNEKDTI